MIFAIELPKEILDFFSN